MQLGTTIKNFRKLKGLKQKELAEKSKISPTYLSQIESNSKDPTLSTIKLISDSLEVPLPVLLFISLDKNDIPKSKQQAFNAIYPSIKNFVEHLFVLK
jgi:transcriptional regulator with XRE-family HTH domain